MAAQYYRISAAILSTSVTQGRARVIIETLFL
jgi:hypothetical protein